MHASEIINAAGGALDSQVKRQVKVELGKLKKEVEQIAKERETDLKKRYTEAVKSAQRQKGNSNLNLDYDELMDNEDYESDEEIIVIEEQVHDYDKF
ncbi:MAG: hypothetical protein HON90_16680, partial [Halobacteriovoraceae bacterium]|nr:hypothetical protein [Halobacteriovoraceae bacterium]